MKILMICSFLLSSVYGVIFYSIGEILSNHFEGLIYLVLGKMLSEEQKEVRARKIIDRIGICCKIIGVTTILVGLVTLIAGLRI